MAQDSTASESKRLLEELPPKLEEMEARLKDAIALLGGADNEREASHDSLRAEYTVLANVLNSRYSTIMALHAVVLLGIVTILSFALANGGKLGVDLIFKLDIDGWIPFFAILLAAVAWLNTNSNRTMNDSTKIRIGEIERQLHIKGITAPPPNPINERVGGFYRKAGIFSWPILYELVIVWSLLTTAQLWPTASDYVYALLLLEVVLAFVAIGVAWKNHKPIHHYLKK